MLDQKIVVLLDLLPLDWLLRHLWFLLMPRPNEQHSLETQIQFARLATL
jgi:hypothetical protein